jgi:Periplasmic copper-binding protein (NosD)
MAVPPNLSTAHADGVGEVVHAADIDDLANAANKQSVALVRFKDIFGLPFERKRIPQAAAITTNAINGVYNWPTAITRLTAAASTLATQLSGVTANAQVHLLPGLYREALPSITVANVRIYGQQDVAITGMDDWSIGGLSGCTWAAAASPNAATSFVSSLTVGAFTVDGDSPPIITAVKAKPEQVMVNKVMYNRVTAGSTLAAGQWMFVNDATDRRVVLRPPVANMTGLLVEVTMRQNWCTPGTGGTGLTLEGIYFYGAASGADTAAPIQQNSQANMTVRSCMLGFTHGICIAGGGAAGFRVIDNVIHNCGTVGVISSSQGTTVSGNVAFNNGGSQNTFSNALGEDGYDHTWGSGFCKLVCDYSTMRDNFCFNNGFVSYWQDVLCRFGVVANNVAWDCREEYIQIEVSSYFRIYGNHIFQTASNQFSATAANGIYISSSRDGTLGPDLSAGQDPNVVMRLGTSYKLGWQTSRTDLPPTGTIDSSSGHFRRVVFQHNVAIIRKTNGQGPGGPDLAVWWSDITSGAPGTAINDASNVGQHVMVGFENATDVVTGMTWPSDFILLSDVTGLTGQDASHYFLTPALWSAIRWGNATDESGRNWPSRYLTYAEQAEMLNWYGLPLLT